MGRAGMDLVRQLEGDGVGFTGSISGCDLYAMGKSKQKVCPQETVHNTNAPMQLVYDDMMELISPSAIGGFTHMSKFKDHDTRMKEVLLLESKTDAVDSLNLYNCTVSSQLGLLIKRLRTDKREEYIGTFRSLCHNTGNSAGVHSNQHTAAKRRVPEKLTHYRYDGWVSTEGRRVPSQTFGQNVLRGHLPLE